MVAAKLPVISLDHYLAHERRETSKHEYLQGLVYLMAGASARHVQIVVNLTTEIRMQFKGRGCRVYSTDLKLITPSGLVAYPDVMALCGQPKLYDERGDVLENPSLIVEVLSPTTATYDRSIKFEHYRSLPSLREYLLVAQDEALIEQHTRQPDGSWAAQTLQGLDAVLTLTGVECTLALADVYLDV